MLYRKEADDGMLMNKLHIFITCFS